MKSYDYVTRGTCSRMIRITLDDNDVIASVQFVGGCSGNTQGVARLVVGKPAREVIASLKGIRCGFKETSCPDQLATALEKMLAE